MRPCWLVLGVGNTLMRDEGAGVHVIRYLENLGQGLADTQLIDGGTLSFSLAPLLQQVSGLIVIDAAQLQAPAGSVSVFEGGYMDDFLGRARRLSVHEVCLTDLLGMALAAGELPQRRALIGIQPASVDWDESPGPSVAGAIPLAGKRTLEILARWRKEVSHKPPAEALA